MSIYPKCGLVNTGTDCYINACTQILIHTEWLNICLDLPFRRKDIPSTLLLDNFNNLRQLMLNKSGTINHKGWIYTIKYVANLVNSDFSNNAQHDIAEFLLFIINHLHDALSSPVKIEILGQEVTNNDNNAVLSYNMVKELYENNYSKIIDLFFGIQLSEICSLDNISLSKKAEPFLILDLAIPKNITQPDLYCCLDEYFKLEKLEKENQWYNETTKTKQDVYKKLLVWKFPKVLIISLKRFNNNLKKDKRLVSFPIDNLNLIKYSNGYNKEENIYELYALCNHSGNIYGGHYTCIIKDKTNKWFEYNDQFITEISKEKVISTKSYCLFYKKIYNNCI